MDDTATYIQYADADKLAPFRAPDRAAPTSQEDRAYDKTGHNMTQSNLFSTASSNVCRAPTGPKALITGTETTRGFSGRGGIARSSRLTDAVGRCRNGGGIRKRRNYSPRFIRNSPDRSDDLDHEPHPYPGSSTAQFSTCYAFDEHPAFKFPTMRDLVKRGVAVFDFPTDDRFDSKRDADILLRILSIRSIPEESYSAKRVYHLKGRIPMLLVYFSLIEDAEFVLRCFHDYHSNLGDECTFRVVKQKTYEERELDRKTQNVVNMERARGGDWRRRDGGNILIVSSDGRRTTVNLRDLENEARKRYF